jgi:hypothetical protein
MSQQAKRAISTWQRGESEMIVAACLDPSIQVTLLLKSHQLLPISSPLAAVSRVFTVACVSRPKTKLNQPGNSGGQGSFLRSFVQGLVTLFHLCTAYCQQTKMHHAVSHVWWETRSPTGRKSMACHGGDVWFWMQRRGWVAVGSIDEKWKVIM